jgi:hypothetical protein
VPLPDRRKSAVAPGGSLGLRFSRVRIDAHAIREMIMRNLNQTELKAVAGGVNPHLKTVSVTYNPGGVVNKSILSNPNAETVSITYKTTGKPR